MLGIAIKFRHSSVTSERLPRWICVFIMTSLVVMGCDDDGSRKVRSNFTAELLLPETTLFNSPENVAS
jgi:hypothetical protein